MLLYRGYPVEQLAERSSFLEVANLLVYGKLPTRPELEEFRGSITRHTAVNDQLMQVFRGFQRDAHPMAKVSAVVASMAAFYHGGTDITDPEHRELFTRRIIAKLPTIAAAAHRHTLGQPFVQPEADLGYCENLLHLLFATPPHSLSIDPVAAEALDLLFILHADHEQNASTSTVRLAGSTGANPYAAISAGISALWGPAHGGANEAVLDMLEQIGSVAQIDRFLARVKDKSEHLRLMGFGHRVYKNFDPRARIIRDMCHRVLATLGGHRRSQVRAVPETRGNRAQGRVLRRPQAVPERRFLLRDHLPGSRHSPLHVHRHVCDRPDRRVGGALAGDGIRPSNENWPSPPALYRPGAAGLPHHGEPR